MAMEQQDTILKDPEMKQYFNTLPAFVQETIRQSGLRPADLQGLKQAAKNLMDKQ